MKRLNKIEIQNFKIFNEAINIPIDGKHVLAWGVNGSGKSSLYWALYTFLQCNTKTEERARVYFNKGDESLHNIHAAENLASYIKVGFKEPDNDEETSELSLAKNDTKSEYIGTVNSGSEFITHRLLLNFYNYRHSQKIDLFPVFFRDIFPYFNTAKGNNFKTLYRSIEEKLNTETKPNLDKLAKEFNDGLEDLIQPIKRGDATKFYNDNLAYKGEKIDIKILFPQELKIEGSKPNRRLIKPIISLGAKLKEEGADEKDILRPQSFFNEARINAIALSIRFILMENRPPVETVKFLVLDDLLISLDMHNRVKVIKLILKKFKDKYQIMIFTHDKGFYREMLKQIEDDKHNWKVMQFYEPNETSQNPHIKFEDDTYLAKADAAFQNRDYESCALFLRKETESMLVKFLDPEMEIFWKQKEWKELSQFISSAKKRFYNSELNGFKRLIEKDISIENLEKLKGPIETDPVLAGDMPILGPLLSYKRNVFNFIINKKRNIADGNNVYELLSEVDKIKDRVLNPAAHAGDAPIFEEEIYEAIEKIKQLKLKLDELAGADEA